MTDHTTTANRHDCDCGFPHGTEEGRDQQLPTTPATDPQAQALAPDIETLEYQSRTMAEKRPCRVRPCDQEFPALPSRWCYGCIITALRAELADRTRERDKAKDLVRTATSLLEAHKDCDVVEARLADAEGKLASVRAHEWSGTMEHVYGCCHVCERFEREGHESDCWLGQALTSLRDQAAPPREG